MSKVTNITTISPHWGAPRRARSITSPSHLRFVAQSYAGGKARCCPRRFTICTCVPGTQSPTRRGDSKQHEATPPRSGGISEKSRHLPKIIPGAMRGAAHALSTAGFAPTKIGALHETCWRNGQKASYFMLLFHANHQGQAGFAGIFPKQQQKRSAACDLLVKRTGNASSMLLVHANDHLHAA